MDIGWHARPPLSTRLRFTSADGRAAELLGSSVDVLDWMAQRADALPFRQDSVSKSHDHPWLAARGLAGSTEAWGRCDGAHVSGRLLAAAAVLSVGRSAATLTLLT